MDNAQIKRVQAIFSTRLDTLNHLLDVAEKHAGAETAALLQQRIAPDMFPLGTQVAFACNQPLAFAQWCAGLPIENLARDVTTIDLARQHIATTLAMVDEIQVGDAKLQELKRIQLGPEMFIEMDGMKYVHEFLMPNFYFHLTTAYNILRLNGASLGKGDYMRHLAPYLQHQA